jgi:sugar (pentulose or hexulose) kinase
MGAPDHQCALVGSGAVRDFEGHCYLGTSSWVECLVPFKKTDIIHSIASIPAAIPGRYQCINEQDVAGGCLSFFLDNVLFRPSRLSPGTLYPLLHRLHADGLLSAQTEVIDGKQRKNYVTTRKGAAALASLRPKLAELADEVLPDGSDSTAGRRRRHSSGR